MNPFTYRTIKREELTRGYEVLRQRWWGAFTGPLQSAWHPKYNRQNSSSTSVSSRVEKHSFFPIIAPLRTCAQEILRHRLQHVKHSVLSQCSQFPTENAWKSTAGKPEAVRDLSHYTQSYLYSIKGRSVLIKTSSAASFSYSLCGVTTLTAIQCMWKFLTSGRAWTNSSQPPFINDGCISLFPCQQDLRNLASRLLKFGLAKSFSVEISVSSTVLICCLIIVQTTPPGSYTQLTSSSPSGKKDPASPVTAPCVGLANMILPVFHFLKCQNLFFCVKAYFGISWGQMENTEFALFKSVIWKKIY